ncbi:MAG: DUF2335 domain-containing protein [Cardiobacterium sp.]|jgi:putative membrane spanning protein
MSAQRPASEQRSGRTRVLLPEEREAIKDIVTIEVRRQMVSYEGPLPPSAEFGRYNEILPGAAERILAMAEREQEARLAAQKAVIDKEYRLRQHGQIYALIIAAAFMFLAGVLIQKGYYLGAVTVLGMIAAIAGIFVSGKSEKANPQKPVEELPPSHEGN